MSSINRPSSYVLKQDLNAPVVPSIPTCPQPQCAAVPPPPAVHVSASHPYPAPSDPGSVESSLADHDFLAGLTLHEGVYTLTRPDIDIPRGIRPGAGHILTAKDHDGTLHALVHIRFDGKAAVAIGGAAEPSDQTLLQAATRENSEEGYGVLQFREDLYGAKLHVNDRRQDPETAFLYLTVAPLPAMMNASERDALIQQLNPRADAAHCVLKTLEDSDQPHAQRLLQRPTHVEKAILDQLPAQEEKQGQLIEYLERVAAGKTQPMDRRIVDAACAYHVARTFPVSPDQEAERAHILTVLRTRDCDQAQALRNDGNRALAAMHVQVLNSLRAIEHYPDFTDVDRWMEAAQVREAARRCTESLAWGFVPVTDFLSSANTALAVQPWLDALKASVEASLEGIDNQQRMFEQAKESAIAFARDSAPPGEFKGALTPQARAGAVAAAFDLATWIEKGLDRRKIDAKYRGSAADLAKDLVKSALPTKIRFNGREVEIHTPSAAAAVALLTALRKTADIPTDA